MAQSSMRASSAARAPGEVAVAARSNNNNHNTSNAGVVYGDFLQRRAGVIKRWTKRWAEWNAGTKVLAWYGPQSRKDTRRGGIGKRRFAVVHRAAKYTRRGCVLAYVCVRCGTKRMELAVQSVWGLGLLPANGCFIVCFS